MTRGLVGELLVRREGISKSWRECWTSEAAINFVAKRRFGRRGLSGRAEVAEDAHGVRWTGLASAFLRAGYHEHRRGSQTRPIMRFVIDQ